MIFCAGRHNGFLASVASKAALGFIIIIALLCAVPPDASAMNADRVLEKVQKKYKKVNSLSAHFTQQTVGDALNQLTLAEGKVYFQKPGKMRWVYEQPETDEIVSNGETLWMYQPDLSQVIETPIDKDGPASLAMGFLTGLSNFKKDFSRARMASDKGGVYVIVLTPRTLQYNLKELFLEIGKKDFNVISTAIVDSFGVETKVTLTQVKLNVKFKKGFFTFKPKKGITVVRP